MLRPGMELRFEVAGFRFAYQKLQIEWVGDDVLGPAEVRRHLGPGAGDGFAPAGASVLVRAVAPAKKFEVDGQSYACFDGMVGRAEVAVRSEPAILALVPGLRLLWERMAPADTRKAPSPSSAPCGRAFADARCGRSPKCCR